MTQVEFQALVDDAYDALLDDDGEKHGRVLRSLKARTVCLSGPVPSGEWGRFLYLWALVRYAAGEPWQELVTAALAADPEVERSFGSDVVRTYTPEVGGMIVVRPELPGSELWMDGRPAPAELSLVGPHILQSSADGVWRSAWVEDGAIPDVWRPVVVPVSDDRVNVALRLHVAVGAEVAFGQVVEVDDLTEPALKVVTPVELGLHLDAALGWARIVGTFTPIVNGPYVFDMGGEAQATRLGGGGHIAGGVTIKEGFVGLLAGIRDPGRIPLQAVGGVALEPSGLRFELRGGVHVATGRRVEPNVGLAIAWAPAVFR